MIIILVIMIMVMMMMMMMMKKPGSQDEHLPRLVASRKTQAENTEITMMIQMNNQILAPFYSFH